MNEVFLTVPYSRVRYLEFPGFVNDVARIVAKYDAAAYFVDGPYNRLLLIQAEVNELEVTYRKLPKTEELMQLRTTRGIIIDTILRLLKNLRKARLASQAEMLKLVTPFLERYLATIQDTNTKLKQEHIRELGKKFDGKTPLQQALDALGLKLFVEELRTIQGNIEVAQNEQIEQMSQVSVVDKKELTIRATSALKNLFSAIEVAKLDHPELDYSPLINELNKYLSIYVTEIKTRATIRKNALAAKKEQATKKATVPTPTSDAVA